MELVSEAGIEVNRSSHFKASDMLIARKINLEAFYMQFKPPYMYQFA